MFTVRQYIANIQKQSETMQVTIEVSDKVALQANRTESGFSVYNFVIQAIK
jgi:hypothetical protein